VQEYKEKLIAELQKPSIATIEEILEYYTRVMRREEKESVVVTIKEKVSGMFPNPQTGEKERKTIEKETAKVIEIPTKVSDANKAAEMLGKNYGIWTEKMSIDGNQNITFVEDLEE
jgi:phage terminase small subunit